MTQRFAGVPLALVLLAALAAVGCVNVDPQTHEIIPRGNQWYDFEDVQSNAKDLELGMSEVDVLELIGSPAEKNGRADVWVYLPERPAVLIPARALRLEFREGKLVEHGYHAIVLGKPL